MVDWSKVKQNIKNVLNTYHFFNVLFSLTFVVTKTIPLLCGPIYGSDECGLSTREHEILIFLGVVIVWKGRKTSSMLHYLSNVYFYSKVVNALLFFTVGPFYGIAYSLAAIIFVILFPEPIIADPSNITFFHGEGLHQTLEHDKSVVWVIEFFATWSTECKYVAPVFAKLAEKYTLKNLRFGKLDVGRYQNEGQRFRINTHPMSKQLPSIAIFRGGVQTNRRPAVGSNQRIIPFTFTEENCIMELDLNEIYKECKDRVNKYEKSKNA